MNSFKLTINKELANKSIRELLEFFHLGKDKINFYKNEKSFFVNQKNVNDDYILNELEVFELKLNEKIDIAPYFKELDVVYEDDYFLVVNKPKNMLMHSDGDNTNECLNNIVANYFKNHHIRRKIRLVNRLDYQTTGLVIYTKDPISESILDYLVRNRQVEKMYYAVCYNKFSKKDGEINLPIGRDRHNSKKMIVYKKGKEAKTLYSVIKNGAISVCNINLITGRTHQIRVHLSYINHPLIGDSLYSNDFNNELLLQAYQLKFIHPFTNNEIIIKIDMDSLIQSYL